MRADRRLLPGQRIRDSVLRSSFGPSGLYAASQPLAPQREPDLPLQPSTWSIRSALAALVSFELLFLLFLSAGRIKAYPFLAWMPVDLTALLFVLSLMAGTIIVLTKKVNLRGVMIAGAMALFVTWLVASLLWTPGVLYAREKALYAVLAFWACAGAAVIIAADRVRVRRFLTLLVVLAVWFAIEGAFAYATAQRRWFVELGGTSYAGLGNMLGHGAVIAAATLISLRRNAAAKAMLAALLGFFVFIILVAGSRHPAIGVALALVLAATVGFRLTGGIKLQRYQIAALALLILAVGAVGILALSGLRTQTLVRLETLFEQEGGGQSAYQRQVVMGQAISFWLDAPVIGNGVGSFPILANVVKDRKYHPHNIILEVLSDLGLVGLLLFSLFVVSALRWVKLHRLRGDPLYRCVFLLAMFDLSHAMLGPDLTEHRMLYSMLGLLAMPAMQAIGAAAPRDARTRGGEQPQEKPALDAGGSRTLSIGRSVPRRPALRGGQGTL